VPPARSDLRLLLVAGAAAVAAGLLMAAVILFATGRGDAPGEYQPFEAGLASDIERQLRDGGPFYIADPFGGDRSIVFALEEGGVAALAVNQSTLPGCSVKWKDQLGRFVCGAKRLRSVELERFAVSVPARGPDEDILIIDLRKRLPAPALAGP
jgi:hypothetical protein